MNGTNDLKFLATKALERLERNKIRNRIGTNYEILVPRSVGDGTRNDDDELTALELLVEFEERVAICHYDGRLDIDEAVKTALLGLFKDL